MPPILEWGHSRCRRAVSVAWAIAFSLLSIAPVTQAATPMVSSHTDFTLALSSEGKVYAWGWDARGQLGTGRKLFSAVPIKIAGLPPLVHVDAGTGVHVVAADAQGNVWTWGQDTAGQLGSRATSEWTKPGRVLGITGVRRVAAGFGYTAALKTDGTVWVWGLVWGQFPDRISAPQQIPGMAAITEVRAGADHLVALKDDGTVWTVGGNNAGQLGDGTNLGVQFTARKVAGIADIVRIAAGVCSSMALRRDGVVFAWGEAACRYPSEPRFSPTAVPGLPAIADVSGGGWYSHAVTANGDVYLWDNNYLPTRRDGFTGVRALEAEQLDDAVALLANGAVAVYGDNDVGQHGNGTTSGTSGVTVVPGLAQVALVSSGYSGNGGLTHFALTASGDLYGWGSNFEGQLAQGDSMLSSVPLEVKGLPKIERIAAGDLAAFAVDEAGRVWGWGDNFGSSLGDGTNTPRSAPVLLPGISGVANVAAGRRFVLLLKSDGTVWMIGMPNGINYSSVPVMVPGLSNIVSVAARYANAYAIRNDGKAFAWGSGFQGMIGDGATEDRASPVLITAFDLPVTSIAAGPFHALARTSDGSVWSWGSGAALGDGVSGVHVRATPARVAGVANATSVAAGYRQSLALLANGEVMSWGEGALGDGAVDYRDTPGPVRTISGVRAVAAGDWASFALAGDGAVYAWGGGVTMITQWSTFGASTGDGTFVFRHSPVLVIRDGGKGNIDSGDWFLDLDPAVQGSPPAGLTPRIVPVANAALSSESISLGAGINFRNSDYGKVVGIHVVGRVPSAFLGQVKLAPWMGKAQLDEIAKADELVLVQLTPSGWATVSGQLIALGSGVISGNGSASNIFSGVRPSTISGARFCIGYGESPSAMLTAATLGEVLTLGGVLETASGVPCLLSGAYVSGPPTSNFGSSVTFTATVVGVSPTGSLQFTDRAVNLGGAVVLSARNEAVATANLVTSGLAVGAHSIGASYGGDARNPAVSVPIPLMHTVSPATTGSAVTLSGPASSSLGERVTLTATVTGNNPTGTVQFKGDGTSLGSAAPILDGVSTLSIATLATGSHTLTATYLGDGANSASTSGALAHTVYPAIATTVSLSSSANEVTTGTSVTFTATVTGNSPTGSVVFRDGATVLGSVSLANGTASLTVAALQAGQHTVTAEYSGDANNQVVTSETLYQLVRDLASTGLQISPPQLAFGGQSMSTTSPAQTVTLTNGGSSAVAVTSLTTSTHFAVTHNCATVNVGGNCTASVTFTPTVTGMLAGTLTVMSGGGAQTAALSGTGERSLVTHYYRSILRRAPDTGGKAFWDGEATRVQALGVNVNEVWFAMAGSFYSSAEYLALNRDNAGYITDLFNTFFNRAPDADGLAYWRGQLDQGLPREVALAAFMFSQEFANFTQAIFGAATTRKEVDTVVDFYRGLLGTLPDDGGFNFWLQQFRAAQCLGGAAVNNQVETISGAFANSTQYQNRARANTQYVGDLYNAFLRRGGDLGGVQFWIGQIATGARSRDNVRQAFVASGEFQARVAAIIAQGCLQ